MTSSPSQIADRDLNLEDPQYYLSRELTWLEVKF